MNMNIDIYAFSNNGAKLCDKIIEGLKEHNIEAFVPEKYVNSACHVKARKDDLNRSVEKSFKEKNCIIFIGAVGIAVRAIAPFIKSKKTDPAVICIDEKGLNIISLLSGHIGGANKLTLKIANIVGGNPIITTATDINNKLAVDEWAHNKNMHILSMDKARDIAADILDNLKIRLKSDFEIIGDIPEELHITDSEDYTNLNDINYSKTGICISLDENKKPFENNLNLIPKIVSVGVGCRKGADFKDIMNAIKEVLTENNISHYAIKSLNSIDLKKYEEGLIKTAEVFNVPFNTYSSDELKKIDGSFTNSNFVKSIAGVDTVCERAAVMGSVSKKIFLKKTIKNSVTVALCLDEYNVDFNF